MRQLRYLALCSVLAIVASVPGLGQESPEWARRDYSAPIEQVFAAALLSLQVQHHEVQANDATNHTVDFHVGTTAWSWGYNMRLTGTPSRRGTRASSRRRRLTLRR
jgi:hypothetical protein